MSSTRVVRPPAPEALDAVRALETEAEARDGYESLASFVWRDLADPSAESTDVLVEDEDRLVAYAHLAPADTDGDAHLVAAFVRHPDHRDVDVTRALVQTLAAEGLERREPVRLWVNGADDAIDAVVQAGGFVPFSSQLQMRVALPLPEPPAWPDGVTVRAFVAGADDADWLRVNNRAFATHPDQGGWQEATLQRRLAEPWFDPAGFLLAFDGDGLAGFCWTKVHNPERPDGEPIGEIYVIGVDPDRQGTGLGRALTVGGLAHLADARGCRTGMLYVDGENDAALALYKALGFTPHRRDRAYVLRPEGS
jgi:mycothiol synthase